MANEQHVQILKRGKATWNAWREANPDLIPDLSGLDIDESFFDPEAAVPRAPGGRLDLVGINFRDADLHDTNFTEADMTGADCSNASMQEAVFSSTQLAGAHLDGANLKHAKFWSGSAPGASFWDAILAEAVLSGANLQNANFTGANMAKVNLEGADISAAELWRVNMEGANLDGASAARANMNQINLSKANLSRCDLRGANLYEANLAEAALDEADVRFADLRRANLSLANVVEIHYNKKSRYRGIRVATCFGSPRFTRTANDQNYIEEFRAMTWDPFVKARNKRAQQGKDDNVPGPFAAGEWLYWLWWFSSDCGRSLWRWAMMSMMFSAVFGVAFYLLGEESFYIGAYGGRKLEWSLETMVYYAMANFAKVSFGAITPMTAAAERWVIASGIAGLVMLGGLITILADKVARRA